MHGFERNVHVPRPREEVFAFATTLENISRWMPTITAVEPISEGPMGPGWQFKETRRIGKKEHSATIEIVEHEAPSVHSAKAKAMGVEAIYRYTFEPDGDGTQVVLKAEVKAKGLAKLMARVMIQAMEKEDGDSLERLRAAME